MSGPAIISAYSPLTESSYYETNSYINFQDWDEAKFQSGDAFTVGIWMRTAPTATDEVLVSKLDWKTSG